MALLYSVAASFGIDEQTEKLSLAEAGESLDRTFRARDRAFEEIRLVGSDHVIRHAREWTRQFYLMRKYLDSPNPNRGEWAGLVGRANEARDAFYAQARKELEIK